MHDEKTLWSMAARILDEHGNGAAAFALGRAKGCAGDEDGRCFSMWVAVADRCSELLRALPSAGESIH